MTTQARARAGDTLAIGLSGLCLIHCLALPVLAATLPFLSVWAEAEWMHWMFAGLAAPISLWTLTRPHPGGRSLVALSLAISGLVLLFAGAAGFPDHAYEKGLSVAGGLMIAAAHLLNLRRRAHGH